jgi:hypothetical protein
MCNRQLHSPRLAKVHRHGLGNNRTRGKFGIRVKPVIATAVQKSNLFRIAEVLRFMSAKTAYSLPARQTLFGTLTFAHIEAGDTRDHIGIKMRTRVFAACESSVMFLPPVFTRIPDIPLLTRFAGATVDATDKEENMWHSRRTIGGSLWPRAGAVLLSALMLTGCASALAVRVPKAGPDTACITPAPDRDVLVGVALSGGGSRAALFGAAGLEALGRLPNPGGGSVLEQVAYLSSVSGGSVAAAMPARSHRGRPRS